MGKGKGQVPRKGIQMTLNHMAGKKKKKRLNPTYNKKYINENYTENSELEKKKFYKRKI